MGLLDGMEGFGIKGMNTGDMFSQGSNTKKTEEKTEKKAPVEEEKSFVFAKKYTCPVCDHAFETLTVKSSRARLIGMDEDLRPKYYGIDTLKYDIVLCPKCGYAAITSYFPNIINAQKKLVRENISANFTYNEPEGDTYSYEEAVIRYKIALSNAMVKKCRDSEKAYICLKMAWVLRGQKENLDKSDPRFKDMYEECEVNEQGALQLAKDGFVQARAGERFPIAGMDETTLDYLISALSYELGDYDTAGRLLSNIIVSKVANNRIKDKARDLLDKVKEKR
ncbi:MAG: DUF2225 domain-containing protein [Lachnospiraceae bacterium]|nr:DUF2225 domain-containing protein [Lachnospiraceae bacterium]